MSSIIDIMGIINKYNGLAGSNRFAVQITPPPSLVSDARDIMFLCETVNIPGITFNTDTIKHKGYGLTEQRPIGLTFDDVTSTFFVDNKGFTLGFFQKWMQLVESFDPNHSRKRVDGMSLESFNYPEDYEATINIYYKDATNEDFMVYTLEKAFPTTMGSTTLGWEMNDTLARFAITFTYKSYSTGVTSEVETTDNQTIDTNSNNARINSVLNGDATEEPIRINL